MRRSTTRARVARRLYRTIFASRGARANAADALVEMSANRRPLSAATKRRLVATRHGRS